MEKVENVDIHSVIELENKIFSILENLRKEIMLLEKVKKLADSAEIEDVFNLTHSELEDMLSLLDKKGFLRSSKDYDCCGLILALRDEINKKDSKSIIPLLKEKFKDDFSNLAPFYKYLSKAIEEVLTSIKPNYEGIKNTMEVVKKIRQYIEQKIPFSKEEVLSAKKYIDSIEEVNCIFLLKSFFNHNEMLIQDIKNKKQRGEILSKEQYLEQKKIKYIQSYHLNIDKSVSIDTIEKVISAFHVDLTFLQNHPEVFSSKLELFLKNLNLLKEKRIPIKLVLDRDADALLCEDLNHHIKLIEMYNFSIEEILLYQKQALTDLSYLNLLDLMIENDCLSLNHLRDKNNVELKKRIVLRLLQIPVLEELLKEHFPLSEEETNEFLDLKKSALKNGSSVVKTCELDFSSLYVDNLTYNFNGILISRPKVLRNSDEGEFDLDTILCNSFYTEEEIQRIQGCFHKEFFKKRRGVL